MGARPAPRRPAPGRDPRDLRPVGRAPRRRGRPPRARRALVARWSSPSRASTTPRWSATPPAAAGAATPPGPTTSTTRSARWSPTSPRATTRSSARSATSRTRFRDPHVHDGRWSEFRKRRFGAPAAGCPPERFVVFDQNHDQVGNRALGDRLPREARPLAAFATLLSPYTPMLWMGEEYGEDAPFQFFTDHIDEEIATATREGRRREFAAFTHFAGEEVPDPQDPATFERSTLTRVGGSGAAELVRRPAAGTPRAAPRTRRRRSCRPRGALDARPARGLHHADELLRPRAGRRRRSTPARSCSPPTTRSPCAPTAASCCRPSAGALIEGVARMSRESLARRAVPARPGLGRPGHELLALQRERRARRAVPVRPRRHRGARRRRRRRPPTTGTATCPASGRASATATASTASTTPRRAIASTPTSC